MSKYKFVKHIPNILTAANMLSGLTAIIFLLHTDHSNKELIVAAIIIFGSILDFLDGHLARKLDAVTSMGKQLDSFADIITFCIAPICLVNSLFPREQSVLILISSGIFLMAGAYRLARYNISDFSDHFVGLPITAAGTLLGIYCALHPSWVNQHSVICTLITSLFIVLLSVMMVSKVKVKRMRIGSVWKTSKACGPHGDN